MNRMTALKIINPILGLLVASQVLTGLCGGLLPGEVFDLVHKGGGFVCAAFALLHVSLNWNWIKATYTA